MTRALSGHRRATIAAARPSDTPSGVRTGGIGGAVMIELVQYDPTWPDRFVREATLLREACDAETIRISHVGSTSIPGITAKPNHRCTDHGDVAGPLGRLGRATRSTGLRPSSLSRRQRRPVLPQAVHLATHLPRALVRADQRSRSSHAGAARPPPRSAGTQGDVRQ